MKGLFLSFEGIDGAGKSTHLESLSAAFRAHYTEPELHVFSEVPS